MNKQQIVMNNPNYIGLLILEKGSWNITKELQNTKKLQKNWHEAIFLCCFSYAIMSNKGIIVFNFVLFSDVTISPKSITISL